MELRYRALPDSRETTGGRKEVRAAGRYNTIVEIRRSIKVGRSGLEGAGGGNGFPRCRVRLSGGLSGRGACAHEWSKGGL